MSKKMMVLAMAVACAALFALPAAASAQSWHNSSSGSASAFSVTGSGGTITSADGSTFTCTKTTGSGSFSTTTEGTVSLVFEGCTAFGFACNSPGQIGGKIAVANSFDAIEPFTTNGTNSVTPGVLLTPTGSVETPAGKRFFVEFSCFIASIKVYGNGVIGTIHNPDPSCSVPSKTFGLNFESSAQGTQKDLTWTGTTYDLITGSASHPTTSFDFTTTLTFASSQTISCTL